MGERKEKEGEILIPSGMKHGFLLFKVNAYILLRMSGALTRVTTAVMKHHEQSNLGRKGFI